MNDKERRALEELAKWFGEVDLFSDWSDWNESISLLSDASLGEEDERNALIAKAKEVFGEGTEVKITFDDLLEEWEVTITPPETDKRLGALYDLVWERWHASLEEKRKSITLSVDSDDDIPLSADNDDDFFNDLDPSDDDDLNPFDESLDGIFDEPEPIKPLSEGERRWLTREILQNPQVELSSDGKGMAAVFDMRLDNPEEAHEKVIDMVARGLNTANKEMDFSLYSCGHEATIVTFEDGKLVACALGEEEVARLRALVEEVEHRSVGQKLGEMVSTIGENIGAAAGRVTEKVTNLLPRRSRRERQEEGQEQEGVAPLSAENSGVTIENPVETGVSLEEQISRNTRLRRWIAKIAEKFTRETGTEGVAGGLTETEAPIAKGDGGVAKGEAKRAEKPSQTKGRKKDADRDFTVEEARQDFNRKMEEILRGQGAETTLDDSAPNSEVNGHTVAAEYPSQNGDSDIVAAQSTSHFGGLAGAVGSAAKGAGTKAAKPFKLTAEFVYGVAEDVANLDDNLAKTKAQLIKELPTLAHSGFSAAPVALTVASAGLFFAGSGAVIPVAAAAAVAAGTQYAANRIWPQGKEKEKDAEVSAPAAAPDARNSSTETKKSSDIPIYLSEPISVKRATGNKIIGFVKGVPGILAQDVAYHAAGSHKMAESLGRINSQFMHGTAGVTACTLAGMVLGGVSGLIVAAAASAVYTYKGFQQAGKKNEEREVHGTHTAKVNGDGGHVKPNGKDTDGAGIGYM